MQRNARPVITQAENNTSYWIGHLKSDPTDHYAGQTFLCPSDGELDNIQVLSSTVQYPGKLEITLHEFNPETKKWGQQIATSSLNVDLDRQSKWLRFQMEKVSLQKGKTYAFRIKTADALVALGEAAHGTQQPFILGLEWTGNSQNTEGNYFSYFSLAFKVELRA